MVNQRVKTSKTLNFTVTYPSAAYQTCSCTKQTSVMPPIKPIYGNETFCFV